VIHRITTARFVHYDLKPEIKANLVKKDYHNLEVPISYQLRTVQAGQRIAWIDGNEAMFILIRCLFTDRG
jgi:hypothetical protein